MKTRSFVISGPERLLPEVELLLCCGRRRLDAAAAARARELAEGGLDWDRAITLACAHGLMPLLCHHLSSLHPDAIPAAAAGRLGVLFMRNAGRNVRFLQELREVVDAFDARGIQAAVLKGPPLAVELYGDIALKQQSDVDLLIRPGDAAEAGRVLESLGYRPQFALKGAGEQALLHFRSERAYLRGETSLVDLHWELESRCFAFEHDMDRIWARTVEVSVEGRRVRTLSPADLLLHLCVHGARHGWDRLILVCDIAEIVRGCTREQIDAFVHLATRTGKRRMVLLALRMADRACHTGLCGGAADARLRRWVDEAFEPIARGAARREDRAKSWRVNLALFDHLGDRLAFCLDQVLTPTAIECELVSLPRPLWSLYYVVRAVRLGLKYGWRLLARRLPLR